MNALVIGYGSIGKRHSRLLEELNCTVSIVSRREVDFPNRYASIREAFKETRPDYVVVANRTNEHTETLSELAQLKFEGRVLVEKPLSDEPVVFPGGLTEETFVAYNFRFHPLLHDLRDRLEEEEIISVDGYAGEYLPDWRPERDYRESYSAHRDQGGGVLRDLSHELDYLNWILGGWNRVSALGGQFSKLEISSDDVFILLLETERCSAVTVHLNYLDRGPHRSLRVNSADHTFEVDFIEETISVDGECIADYDLGRDATYRAEHEAVLDRDYGKLCTFREGQEVVELIDAAEKSASNQTWVSK